VNTTTPSEGTAFVQRSDKDNKNLSKKDKEFWKTKTCYNCNKKGHPSTHCPHKKQSDGDDKTKNDDDKSRSSKSSDASDISKPQKKMKKSFATMETKIHELSKADSDISESDEEEEGS
jgi:hypothetical protein